MRRGVLVAAALAAGLALWAPAGGRGPERMSGGEECHAATHETLTGMQRKYLLYAQNSARKVSRALRGMVEGPGGNPVALAIASQWTGEVAWSSNVPTSSVAEFRARKGSKGCVYVNVGDAGEDAGLYSTINTQLFRALAQAARRGGQDYRGVYEWLLVQNRSWRPELPVKS